MNPAPYPADVRAKGWRFELDLEQISQSDTWALSSPEIRPWLLMLWSVSWQQVPCGSLPGEDAIIAARIGMKLPLFNKHKAILLRGWQLADDGRLYHPIITERVLSMLETKQKEKDRKAAYRAKMSGNVPRDKYGTDTGQTPGGHGIDTGRDATRTGTGLLKPEVIASNSGNLTVGTLAGAVCARLKSAGITGVNPSHAKLRSMLQAGYTVDEIASIGEESRSRGKGMSWVMATAEGRRRDAAVTTFPAGKNDRGAPAWWTSEATIIAKGEEIGIRPRPGETMDQFKGRINVEIGRRHGGP